MKKRILWVLILFMGIESFLFCRYLFASGWKSYNTKNGLVDNMVQCIAINRGKKEIWFGTTNGVSCFNRKKKRWVTYTTRDGLISNKINCILIDGEDVWFGTKEGLTRFNQKTKKWISYEKNIETGLVDNQINALLLSKGSIWIGTEGGLNRFDKKKGIFSCYTKKEGLFDNRVKSLIRDGEYVVIGVAGAVINVFDLAGNKWNTYLPEEIVYSNILLAQEAGIIWCGTDGGGVWAYNKMSKEWKNYTMEKGLVDDFVQTIAADGRYIWVGTFGGVSCFDIFTEKWQTFLSKDGLLDDSVNAIAIDGEYVWLGTDNGVSRYKKEVPQISIDLVRNSFTDFEYPLKIDCYCFSYKGIKKINVEYSTIDFPDVWIKEGIKITAGEDKEKGHLVIDWNFDKLPSFNDYYNLRLTASGKKGKTNSSLAVLYVNLEKKLKGEIVQLNIHEILLFDIGSAQIKEEGFKILDKIVALLQEHPEAKIKIEGHTDNLGIGPKCIYRTNLEISNIRGKNVFKYLISKSRGLSENFLVTGYGESKPIASNATVEGRTKNRRVEIVVTSE